MKNKSFVMCAAVFIFLSNTSFSQKNKEQPLDSALEAHSDNWKVKQHRGVVPGLAKPEFGIYTTLVVEKLDSPVIKKKSKDSSEVGYSSYEGLDLSKYKTIEKTKFYRAVLGKETDSIEIQFFIHAVSNEKRQTMLGKMLNKNDLDETTGYKKNIEGTLVTAKSTPAYFAIEDFISTRQVTRTDPSQSDPITTGYILIGTDSLYTETVVKTFGNPKSSFFMQMQKGIFMNDASGKHIAFLQLDNTEVFYVRIHKDISADYQDAIASFFAVIIGVKDL